MEDIFKNLSLCQLDVYLSVPRRLLVRSKWLAIGTEKFEIATGALVEQEIYVGEIIFDGQQGPVYSIATETKDILVGTKLLRGKTLVVNPAAWGLAFVS